jgi:hypothetical protein
MTSQTTKRNQVIAGRKAIKAEQDNIPMTGKV